MTYYAIAYVPAGLRSAAEAAVAPFLLGSGAVWTVPLASTTAPTVTTHYGLCAAIHSDSELAAALPTLKAAFPGSDYHTVEADQYSFWWDWVQWLFARNLTPKQEQI